MKISAVAVLLLAISYIAVPKLLSTDYVRERVTGQLTAITGLPVSLTGGSSITLRPYLSVQYNNVTIGESENAIVKMDGLRARLSLFSALWGDARLSELEMVRPIFNLSIDEQGVGNWSTKTGLLAEQLELPEGNEPIDVALGELTIRNGILNFQDLRNGRTEKITSIGGTVTWPSLTAALTTNFIAVWRGENIALATSIDNPYDALRSDKTKARFNLQSAPANLAFDGELQDNNSRAIGTMTGSSPSVERFLTWMQMPLAATSYLGATTISGDVNMAADTLDFAEINLKVGEHSGVGRLQIKRDEDRMFDVSGTLAFETIGLPPFSFRTGRNRYSEETFDLSSLKGFNLDVRLSSPVAQSQEILAENIAASIIVRNGAANIDVGQADAFGGQFAGSVALKPINGETDFSSRFSFNNIELSDLSRFYGQDVVLPVGRGNANLQFESKGSSADEMMKRLNGEGRIVGLNGTLEGIDLAEILETAEGDNERIWQSLSGETPYSKLNLGFFIANGTAFLRGSELENDGLNISLGGGTDLAERSLALRGTIKSKDGSSLPFFVGGTTSSPLFVPLRDAVKPAPESAADEKRQSATPSQ